MQVPCAGVKPPGESILHCSPGGSGPKGPLGERVCVTLWSLAAVVLRDPNYIPAEVLQLHRILMVVTDCDHGHRGVSCGWQADPLEKQGAAFPLPGTMKG